MCFSNYFSVPILALYSEVDGASTVLVDTLTNITILTANAFQKPTYNSTQQFNITFSCPVNQLTTVDEHNGSYIKSFTPTEGGLCLVSVFIINGAYQLLIGTPFKITVLGIIPL
jgi:hypothetical protein